MAGQEIDQVFSHTNRPHTWTTTTVGDAKGLMQIQMADIGPNVTRPAEPYLSIQVGTIHIDLTAIRVDDFANLFDPFFKDSVRGRIRDHQRSQVLLVGFGFGAEISDIDVAVFVTGDSDDFESRHDGAGGIGSVGRRWDKANIAVRFTSAGMIFANHEQPRVFTLRTSVWLERNAGKPGDFREPILEVVKQGLVAARLS